MNERPDPLAYTPYYCEENAWHLCQRPELAPLDPHVVFVSNARRCVPMWAQRAAPEGEPVLWDYHVVVVTRAPTPQVWDLDSRLGLPVPATRWLSGTFAHLDEVRASFHPRCRVVAAAELVATFSTDRSHMRGPDGGWLQPPPPWPAPYAPSRGMNLFDFVDPGATGAGQVLDLPGLSAWLSAAS